MSFRVVVDFDKCESNALCMAASRPRCSRCATTTSCTSSRRSRPTSCARSARKRRASARSRRSPSSTSERVSDLDGHDRARHGRRQRHRARCRASGSRPTAPTSRSRAAPRRASPRRSPRSGGRRARCRRSQYAVCDVTDRSRRRRAPSPRRPSRPVGSTCCSRARAGRCTAARSSTSDVDALAGDGRPQHRRARSSCIKHAAPVMARGGGGSIIGMSSIAGVTRRTGS